MPFVATACAGSGVDRAAKQAHVGMHKPATVTVAPTTAMRAALPTTPPAPSTAGPAGVAGPADPPAPAPTTGPSPADRLVGVGSANQVIAVVADSYGSTTATFTAYQRFSGGWQTVFGPWDAHIGFNGFAPPGAKHEGDGRTPSGAYGFDFLFGVEADPGVHFPYRRVTSIATVWDDDSTSALYNEWVDTTTQDAGADPEPMYNLPAYSYGAVIAYNEARAAGLGSAIFLHVSTDGPTAGCVSLPASQLLLVLRWLDPAQGPRIVMGTAADVAS
jgi:L,D-peptidoglycan transpeptidase YkuD (ErfK/YbiS/YcfS/YnhG family)